jgi:hypothetical protein
LYSEGIALTIDTLPTGKDDSSSPNSSRENYQIESTFQSGISWGIAWSSLLDFRLALLAHHITHTA